MPTVLVTAASGKIGSKLIPLLLKVPDIRLVLPTSNAAKLASTLPNPDLVTIVEGSIQDPQWLESQLRSHIVDTVFLCLTGTDELFTTLNFYSALQRTPSIKHIVYLSACGDFNSSLGLGGLKSAHCVVKGVTEMALQDLATEMHFTYTILGPALFFTNDLRQKTSIVNQSFYSEPLGKKGVARISTEDIADAAKIAIVDQGQNWNEKKIMIGSKRRYTDDDTAALWTDAMGRPIKAASSDDISLNILEGHFRELLSPSWARDLRLMFEWIREVGFGPTDAQYDELVTFLGREPHPYDEFVKATADTWK